MSDQNAGEPTPAPPVPPTAYPPSAPQYAPPPAAPAAPAQYAPPASYAPPAAAPAQVGPPPAYAPPGYTPYPAGPKTNALAIVSLVSSLVGLFLILPLIGSVAAVITGHIALRQLKTSGESGHGMALAGTIIGWVGVGLIVLVGVLFLIFFFFTAVLSAGAASTGYLS
jgi:hypothetical protein